MRATPKRSTAHARMAARSSAPTQHGGDGSVDVVDEEAGLAVGDQLRHRAAVERDHRRPARHRLDDAVAERFVEPDEMQQRVRAAEQLRSLVRPTGADERHLVAVDARRDELVEVLLVLHDAGDHERHPARGGNVDRFCRSLVGMNSAEEQQIVARPLVQRERVGVDAVVDRRG